MMNKIICFMILKLVSSLALPKELLFRENTTDQIPVNLSNVEEETSPIPEDVRNSIIESSSYNPLTGGFSVLNTSLGNSTGYILGKNNKRYRVNLKKKTGSNELNSKENDTTTQRIFIKPTFNFTTLRTSVYNSKEITNGKNHTLKVTNSNNSTANQNNTDSNIVKIIKADSPLRIGDAAITSELSSVRSSIEEKASNVSTLRTGKEDKAKISKFIKDEKGKFIAGLKEVKPKQKFRVTTYRTTSTTKTKKLNTATAKEIGNEADSTEEIRAQDKNIITSLCQILNIKPNDFSLLARKFFGLDIDKPNDLEKLKGLYDDFIETLKASPGLNATKFTDLIGIKDNANEKALRTTSDIAFTSSDTEYPRHSQDLLANLTQFLKPLVDVSVDETKNILANASDLSQPEISGTFYDVLKNNLQGHINITTLRSEDKTENVKKGDEYLDVLMDNLVPKYSKATEKSLNIAQDAVPQEESLTKYYSPVKNEPNFQSLKDTNPHVLTHQNERFSTPSSQNSQNIIMYTKLSTDDESNPTRNTKPLKEKLKVTINLDDILNKENSLKPVITNTHLKPEVNEEKGNKLILLDNVLHENKGSDYIPVIETLESPYSDNLDKQQLSNSPQQKQHFKLPQNIPLKEYPIERIPSGKKRPEIETTDRNAIPENIVKSILNLKPKALVGDSSASSEEGGTGSSNYDNEVPKRILPNFKANPYVSSLKTTVPEPPIQDPEISIRHMKDRKNPQVTTVNLDDFHHFVNQNEVNAKELTTELNQINGHLTSYSNEDSDNSKENVLINILQYQVPFIIQKIRSIDPNVNSRLLYKDLIIKLIELYPQYAENVISKLILLNDIPKKEFKVESSPSIKPKLKQRVTLIKIHPKQMDGYSPYLRVLEELMSKNKNSAAGKELNSGTLQRYSNMSPQLEKIIEEITNNSNENINVIARFKETILPVLSNSRTGTRTQSPENVSHSHPLQRKDYNLNLYELFYQEMPKLIYQIHESSPNWNIEDIRREVIFAFSKLYPELADLTAGVIPNINVQHNLPILVSIRNILAKPEFKSGILKIPINIRSKVIQSINRELNADKYASDFGTSLERPSSPDIDYYSDISKSSEESYKLEPYSDENIFDDGKSPPGKAHIYLEPVTHHVTYSNVVPIPIKLQSQWLLKPGNKPFVNGPAKGKAKNNLYSRPVEYLDYYDFYRTNKEDPDYSQEIYSEPTKVDSSSKLFDTWNVKPPFIDDSKRHMTLKVNQQKTTPNVLRTKEEEPIWLDSDRESYLENKTELPLTETNKHVPSSPAVEDGIRTGNPLSATDIPVEHSIPKVLVSIEDPLDHSDTGKAPKFDVPNVITTNPTTELPLNEPLTYIETPNTEVNVNAQTQIQAAESKIESILDIPTPSFRQQYQLYATNILKTTLNKLKPVLEGMNVAPELIIEIIENIYSAMMVEIEEPKGSCPNVQIENFIIALKTTIKKYTIKAGILGVGK